MSLPRVSVGPGAWAPEPQCDTVVCLLVELDTRGKILQVVTGIAKGLLLFGFLYLFICSLDILSSAFQLVGGNKHLKKSMKSHFLSAPTPVLLTWEY